MQIVWIREGARDGSCIRVQVGTLAGGFSFGGRGVEFGEKLVDTEFFGFSAGLLFLV